jgi:hypothetical protein
MASSSATIVSSTMSGAANSVGMDEEPGDFGLTSRFGERRLDRWRVYWRGPATADVCYLKNFPFSLAPDHGDHMARRVGILRLDLLMP